MEKKEKVILVTAVLVLLLGLIVFFVYSEWQEERRIRTANFITEHILSQRETLYENYLSDIETRECTNRSSCGAITIGHMFLDSREDTEREAAILEEYSTKLLNGEDPRVNMSDVWLGVMVIPYDAAYKVVMVVSSTQFLMNETSERFLRWESEAMVGAYDSFPVEKWDKFMSNLSSKGQLENQATLKAMQVISFIAFEGGEHADVMRIHQEFMPGYCDRHYKKYVNAVEEEAWLNVSFESPLMRTCVDSDKYNEVSPSPEEVREELSFILLDSIEKHQECKQSCIGNGVPMHNDGRGVKRSEDETELENCLSTCYAAIFGQGPLSTLNRLSKIVGKDLVCEVMTEEEKEESKHCLTL